MLSRGLPAAYLPYCLPTSYYLSTLMLSYGLPAAYLPTLLTRQTFIHHHQ